MRPQTLLGRASAPDGTELVLYERDGVFAIRIGGLELMTSRAHGSEEVLAERALAALNRRHVRVLVGGLGMGYTLRAVLDARPPVAAVVVSELLPEVVVWNREHLGHLAGSPLDDPRVSVVVGDIAHLVAASPGEFDAVLLDVDNGPSGVCLPMNLPLYRARGLAAIHRCLRPGGVLGVWSTDPDPRFHRTLKRAGFSPRSETVHARNVPRGTTHEIYIARRR